MVSGLGVFGFRVQGTRVVLRARLDFNKNKGSLGGSGFRFRAVYRNCIGLSVLFIASQGLERVLAELKSETPNPKPSTPKPQILYSNPKP